MNRKGRRGLVWSEECAGRKERGADRGEHILEDVLARAERPERVGRGEGSFGGYLG